MSLVKFASLCDTCGKRSEEYTEWPDCTECGDHSCCTPITGEKSVEITNQYGEFMGDGERPVTVCKECK